MVFEVDEEPLPPGWEVLMSRKQNTPYYYNARTTKTYWVDDELPRGWSHQHDDQLRRYYFHIRDKQSTISYDKPVLRRARARSPDEPPLPALPEPSYDPHPQASHTERKKPNSLMDLLSPGPPALGADERSPGATSPRPAAASARASAPLSSMDIANLVTSSESATASTRLTGSKRPASQMLSDHDAAADFYNKLKRNAAGDRAESMLFHMRAMNNWVKSILIADHSKRGDRVLDLACGKGGDLMKWAKRGVAKYVGVDIAQKSLEDAVERVAGNAQSRELDVAFVQGDLGAVSLTDDALPCWSRDAPAWTTRPTTLAPAFFHVVSMQFSFHYMFGDEARARRFFHTLHSLLVDGGVFIATTVDPNMVLMKYYQNLGASRRDTDNNDNNDDNNDNNDTNASHDDTGDSNDICIRDEKKREVCTIRFDASIREQLIGRRAAREGQFGLRYKFTLRDSDAEGGGEAVDTPEYLVPDDLLARMLQEHGFELLLKQNFHQFILKNLDANRALLEKMKVMNYDGSISDAEWEIAGLYQVVAFKKAY
ncbi:hypothetical protein PybrP1_003616 [[Pythium] brassicae (nom. inval.)]|nr:hypothetical protein PybrP1_003616 [[Pythium] brassicae (nom. inval.)]